MPNIDLPPDLVLLLFVAPLIYNAAFFTAPRETRENAVPITALAVGTTAITILGVGAVTHLVVPDVGRAPALAFAAAVAPTDAVAATSVLSRLGAPARVVTILECEGLINDAVALTAFGLAVWEVWVSPQESPTAWLTALHRRPVRSPPLPGRYPATSTQARDVSRALAGLRPERPGRPLGHRSLLQGGLRPVGQRAGRHRQRNR